MIANGCSSRHESHISSPLETYKNIEESLEWCWMILLLPDMGNRLSCQKDRFSADDFKNSRLTRRGEEGNGFSSFISACPDAFKKVNMLRRSTLSAIPDHPSIADAMTPRSQNHPSSNELHAPPVKFNSIQRVVHGGSFCKKSHAHWLYTTVICSTHNETNMIKYGYRERPTEIRKVAYLGDERQRSKSSSVSSISCCRTRLVLASFAAKMQQQYGEVCVP